MRIGFHTNSLGWQGVKSLKEIADWADRVALEDMEVGPAVSISEEILNEVMEKNRVDITTLIYCRNFLDHDVETAKVHIQNMKERIELAGKLGIKKVVSCTGVTQEAFYGMRYDPERSITAVTELYKRFIELADKNNVKIAIENCPMMGNIAISPYMWEKLFSSIESDSFGLCYDPSHLVWQMIDPYDPIKEFGHKIFHVHGKDTEILRNNLNRVGIIHNITEENHFYEHQWWRHRLPGLGEVNWGKVIANLDEIGYDGTLSIEHEDPVWEGNLEKVQQGILKAKKHLERFL